MKKSFAEAHPELISEWSDRNLPLSCSDVSYGSKKLYWWKGKCGHEWQTSPKARSAGEGCPICSGARVAPGINDLGTLYPEIATEWADETIKPSEVLPGSHKHVKWRCRLGHEWIAEIKSRTLGGNGCPYCSHNKVLAGFNDLASTLPDSISEWDYEMNGVLRPDQVTAFTHKKVWWKCSKGHSYQMNVADHSDGHGCPYCSGHKLLPGFNDLEIVRPDIAKEWSDRNLPLKPSQISSKIDRSFWWKCSSCGYEWKGNVRGRLKGVMCPVCADRKVKAGVNDLAFTDPEIAAEWDYTLNKGRTPEEVSRHSSKRAWWICPHGHSWNSIIYMRTLEGMTCTECERQFRMFALRLMALYCARSMGLEILIDSDELIGVPLEVYIPDISLVLEMKERGSYLQKKQDAKAHMLKVRGITYITVDRTNDIAKFADEVVHIFRRKNVFFGCNASDLEENARHMMRILSSYL